MGDRGGGHHIGGAGADGAGAGHHAAPVAGLGEGDGRERHGLLVMGAEGRQLVAQLRQGLADAGDIAMAEDGEDAGEERQGLAVDLGRLRGEIAQQGLGHGHQRHDVTRSASAVPRRRLRSSRVLRALRQISISRP